MKGNVKQHIKLLVLVLDDVAVLVVVFLVLHFLKIAVPLWMKIVIALAFGAFAFIIHKAVMSALHRKKTTGSEGMIGLKGTVIESLTPKGFVRAEGESWKAKSVDENIEAGEEVEILGVDGLTLRVTAKYCGE